MRLIGSVAILALTSAGAKAHDIPNDVSVQVFVKPAGQTLELLVRVPLKAMRDIEFPKRGPGYLDLPHVELSLRDAATVWIGQTIGIYEDQKRLAEPRLVAVQASLESDTSFSSYQQALAHVTASTLPEDTQVAWDQTLLDVLYEYPIQSDRSEFSIRPGFERLGLRVVTVLRFLPPNGVVRAYQFTDDPGLVHLDPRWFQASLRFVQAGFVHILDGADHLLFLLCLVIPIRRIRPLILVVTSFTLAHSFALIASAYGFVPDELWFPPLIETLIAVSIVYMAFENIVGTTTLQRRWLIAFGFGLVHGFGFSFALRQTLQFAGSHLLTSLLAFNLGVELGQLLVLGICIPVLTVLFRFVVAERMGTIILSALVAHTAWHWMIDRWTVLRQFRFNWPVWDVTLLASAMRWAMLILAVAGFIWSLRLVLRRRASDDKTGRGVGYS